MSKIREYTNYLIYLCRCAVNGSVPTEKIPESIDFETFFNFCYDHQLVGLAYDMLKNFKIGKEDSQTMLIFKDKHNHAFLKDASQAYYLELICDEFEKSGIDYAPLKGSVIKNIYPLPYYRQCTDMDILIRPGDTFKAREIMEKLGFENKTFGDPEGTDNYRADKYTYAELHKRLIPSRFTDLAYCNEIIDRLINKSGHLYVMSDEDFYIYMVAHAAKHVKWSAIGIRALLDIWIYLRKYPDLDRDLIDRELEKCSLTEFHKKLFAITDYWFGEKDAPDEIKALADYIAESGWNGSIEQIHAYAMSEKNAINHSKSYIKAKNFFSVAFMSRTVLQKRYPALEKHPYLLPLCWVHRGFAVIFSRRKSINSLMHAYDDIDMDKSAQIDTVRKNFGL